MKKVKKTRKWLSFVLALTVTQNLLLAAAPTAMAAEFSAGPVDAEDGIFGSDESSNNFETSEPNEEISIEESNTENGLPAGEEENEEETENDLLASEVTGEPESGDENQEEFDLEEEVSETEPEEESVTEEEPIIGGIEEVSEEMELFLSGSNEELILEETAASYEEFISALKVLEGYADAYAAETGESAAKLIINYVRTGVERYTSESWAIMAGKENTEFITFVSEQDKENETNASILRNIELFKLPNGNEVDFGHMFGTMDIISYNGNIESDTADMGGWAGDICDLVTYSFKHGVSAEDIEGMAKEIQENYLHADVDGEDSFGDRDIYGDLDAFYIMNHLAENGGKLSNIMENYFTASLTEKERAVYFLNHKFPGKATREAVREAVCVSYKNNSGIILLEADRGISEQDDLKTACCYAFADYLYDLAKDELEGTEPEEPEEPDEPEIPENNYYSVFSSSQSTLAPGITQDIKYALTADKKQIVYYTATVDISRNDVNIYANYRNNDGSSWGMSRVTDQMAAAQEKHSNPDDPQNYIENYTTVAGVNADFYNMTTGAPQGALVMEGITYHGNADTFFAILKDGTPIIGGSKEWNAYKDQIQEAVGASVYLVKDGKLAVTASQDYYKNRASRTCVGITADGKVVLMVLDGRQEPFSAGGSAVEIAQIMLEAGCVTAVNLDGGGSTTYAAKQEGADHVTVVNRPSDGYERSVSSSLLVVSTAKTSNEFDHALISSDVDYLTVGTEITLNASGVSASGNTADIPEGAVWSLSDNTKGAVSDGVFTAYQKGDVDVRLVLGETILGSKTLHIVEPDALSFTKDKINAVYGVEVPLPLIATYNGNQVAVQSSDIELELSDKEAGRFQGLTFTGDEESGIRVAEVTASLVRDLSVHASVQIFLYKNGEAVFDFDNATGTMDDGTFGWDRDVSNSTSTTTEEDGTVYHITDPKEAIDISYVFALDMKGVKIPEQLKPMIALLPGGDSADATAWNFMLQLAERISVLTEVKVEINIDPNLDIDYSNLTLSNEYFTLNNVEFNEETHTLTAICKWIDQTQAIDPATANPICILSGIKATPKADAGWDENNRLVIKNSGVLSYDIYLRSSTLYSVASNEAIQQQYGLFPFKNPDVIVGGAPESGAHFGTTYITFEDQFTLDKTNLQGWVEIENKLYYFNDNAALTGIRKVPGYQDEKNEYYYNFGVDGVSQGKYTGLFEADDAKYYAINGELMSSWRMIPDENGNDQYYYFNYQTHKAVDGEQTIGGYDYVFENNVLVKGCWVHDGTGIKYAWAGHVMQNEWFIADGRQYFAYANSCYVATGIKKTLNHERTGEEIYVFDENGVWLENVSGFYDYEGETYWVDKGVRVAYPGLIKVGDDYYYFNSSHSLVKDKEYFISKTNGLMPSAKYYFDKDGKMVLSGKPSDPDAKNGIVKETADTWYYYVNGVKNYAGLIQIDGDYYYVTSSFLVIHSRSYFISKTNGLMPQGTYEFDEDGRMVLDEKPDEPVDPTPDPDVQNGIVKETDSTWYYYVNGVKTYAGLIQIDGDYYYVNSSFQVIHGRSYFVSKTNNLKPQATYEFDAEGKLLLNEDESGAKLNGIIKNTDGTWYYYVNGIKTYAGLIQIDGDYYYVNSAFQVVHDRSYFISKTNGLLPQASYTFDSEGRLISK